MEDLDDDFWLRRVGEEEDPLEGILNWAEERGFPQEEQTIDQRLEEMNQWLIDLQRLVELEAEKITVEADRFDRQVSHWEQYWASPSRMTDMQRRATEWTNHLRALSHSKALIRQTLRPSRRSLPLHPPAQAVLAQRLPQMAHRLRIFPSFPTSSDRSEPSVDQLKEAVDSVSVAIAAIQRRAAAQEELQEAFDLLSSL